MPTRLIQRDQNQHSAAFECVILCKKTKSSPVKEKSLRCTKGGEASTNRKLSPAAGRVKGATEVRAYASAAAFKAHLCVLEHRQAATFQTLRRGCWNGSGFRRALRVCCFILNIVIPANSLGINQISNQ